MARLFVGYDPHNYSVEEAPALAMTAPPHCRFAVLELPGGRTNLDVYGLARRLAELLLEQLDASEGIDAG